MLLWCVLGLRIVLPVASLYLQALRGRRHHSSLLLRKEGDLLLLYLPLLLLYLLLLQELYLGIDFGDGLSGGGRRHHGRRYGRMRGASCDGGDLTLHGSRQEGGSIGSTHWSVEGIAMRSVHHVVPSLLLKVKVELHTIAQATHVVQVEELLKVIVGCRVHAVVVVLLDWVVVPCCRVHHGRARPLQRRSGRKLRGVGGEQMTPRRIRHCVAFTQTV